VNLHSHLPTRCLYRRLFWRTVLIPTRLEWKELLFRDKYKDIVIEGIRLLAKNMRVIIYGFVIMNNHIHIHENPVRASRLNILMIIDILLHLFYKIGKDNRGFLTHLSD
jgi:REP element-mobilizing transposase RayT